MDLKEEIGDIKRFVTGMCAKIFACAPNANFSKF